MNKYEVTFKLKYITYAMTYTIDTIDKENAKRIAREWVNIDAYGYKIIKETVKQIS